MPLRSRLIAALPIALLAASGGVSGTHAAEGEAAGVEFFESKVRPILVNNCYNCHSANTNARGGLRVDDRNGLVNGGNSGPAVVPGSPDESLLIEAVRYEGLEMPPKKRLSEEEVATLEKWIKDGAAWPAVEVAAAPDKPNERYEKLKKEHWAWQPLAKPEPPNVADASWARDDIDRFILAKLEEKGLKPVGDADRVTLLRRASFDLTGLPPTPAETAAFVDDPAPDAFEKVVDRLLASPAFGERWGRHWLDVARYGESTGSSRNLPFPQAWRYRDYVIDAVNADKKYDDFIREQIAGDLLPAGSDEERDEHWVATGFLALGVKDVNQRFKVRFTMDNVDEQIDTVSRSVLGLTVACARCHDHKFDPIPTKDYYALAGIFTSTDLCAGVRNKMGGGGLDYYDTQMLLVAGPAGAQDPDLDSKIEAGKKAVAEARAEFEKLRDDPNGAEPGPDGRPKRQVARQKMNRLQVELSKLTDPEANGRKVVLGVRDSKTVADTQVRVRGEAEKLGPVVARGFLSLLALPDQPQVGSAQSGRLELAQWLTSPANPLTPRVLANRAWHHLFGKGIVKSVDNFGSTGDVPSHPELLDHLANRFVSEGWSLKKLVRAIVLTRAYRLGAEAPSENQAVDPENRLVWRHGARRLDAEEIRDAILAASGRIDRSRPEASPAKELKVIEIRNNGPEARKLQEAALASVQRSVYLPLVRGIVPGALEVFDFAEQGMVTGSRDTTTVAPQALYLLNDSFVRRRSLDLAGLLLRRTDLDAAGRLDLAYRLVLNRPPTAQEVERAKSYIAEFEVAAVEFLNSPPAEPVAVIAVADAAPQGGNSGSSNPASKPEEKDKAEADAKPKKPMPILDPDQVVPEEVPVKEEVIRASTPAEAAWASFCQALLGSGEFRYLR
jgi:hypothetical protein